MTTVTTVNETPDQLAVRLREERYQRARMDMMSGLPLTPEQQAERRQWIADYEAALNAPAAPGSAAMPVPVANDGTPVKMSPEESLAWERRKKEAEEAEEQTHRERMLMLTRSPEEYKAGIDLRQSTEDEKGSKDGSFYAFSGTEMRGAAVPFIMGDVRLLLTPLKRRVLRDEFTPLLEDWPRVLQFAAAVQKPKVAGIDLEAVAALMSVYEAAQHGQSEQERQRRSIKDGQTFESTSAPAPVTADDVAALSGALVDSFDNYLPTICDLVWLMAKGTPGLAWPRPGEGEGEGENATPPDGCEWLDDYLDNRLYMAEYADLLRGCLKVNGTFPGSTYSRFAPL